MLKQVFLIVLLMLGFKNTTSAQEITGNIQGEVKDLLILRIEKIPEGINDLKIQCVEHKEGDGYTLQRAYDNTPVIQVYSKVPTTFTFIVAGNKDSKTIIATKMVRIIQPGPPLPDPDNPNPKPPVPTPTDLTKRLEPFYRVSPDDAAKQKFIEIYAKIANTTYPNYQQAGIDLENQSKQLLGDALQPLRGETRKYLVEKLGLNTGSQWDAVLFKKTFQEISQAVMGIR